MATNTNLKEIVENELVPLAKDYGFNLSLKDFLIEETELKEHLPASELVNISGGASAKPFMFTAVTLFGLLGISAAAGHAFADELPQKQEIVNAQSVKPILNLQDSPDATENNENDTAEKINKDEDKDEDNNIINTESMVNKKNDNTVNITDKPIENENNNVGRYCAASINGNPFESLESAIYAAESGDTIVIEDDIMVDHEIKISKDLTIIANGQKTIKRAGLYSDDIFVVNNAVLNIGDDNIQNRLIFDGAKTPVSSYLIYCKDSTLNIKNTTFCNSFTYTYGSAIYFRNGDLNISGQTKFFNNSAKEEGSAINFDNGNLSIKGQTEFYDNSTQSDGGAIYCFTGSNLYLDDNVKFHDNKVVCNNYPKYKEDKGGAISFYGINMVISGQVEFYNNSARYGAVIWCYLETKLSVSGNAKFYNNNATLSGGVFYLSGKELRIFGQVEFYNNSAENYGGVIFCDNSTYISLNEDIKFHDNKAGYGGVIQLVSSNIDILGQVEFYNNSARYGGVLCSGGICNVSLKGNAKLYDNMASASGGVFYFSLGNFNIAGQVDIFGNSAKNGGVMYCCKYYLHNNIVGTDKDGNYIYKYDEDREVFIGDSVKIHHNNADVFGGVAYSEMGNISIYGQAEFFNNSAKYGGAFNCYKDSSLVAEGHAKFYNNSAICGGAILVYHSLYSCLRGHVKVENNKAEYGGGVFIRYGIFKFLEEAEFIGNSAVYGGAVCFDNDKILYVTVDFYNRTDYPDYAQLYLRDNVNVCDNIASKEGGAFWIGEGLLEIVKAPKIRGNKATDSGNGIYLSKNAHLHLARNTVIDDDIKRMK